MDGLTEATTASSRKPPRPRIGRIFHRAALLARIGADARDDEELREKKALTDEIKGGLEQVVSDFKASWQERAFNPQPDPPADPTKVATEASAGAGA